MRGILRRIYFINMGKVTVKELFKILFTFGLKGDYYILRSLTLKYKFLFYPYYKLYEALHCAYLPLTNEISGYVDFVHKPYGCFLSSTCKLGTGCTIMQNVTIGSNYVTKGESGGSPILGNNVFVGAGAKVIGKINIGNNVKIGAGCVVVTDIPDNATVVLNKPRIILK